MTVPELENKMAVLLGGRAAEAIVFDRVSTGGADDLAKVTQMARSMVAQYGMDKTLGNVAYERPRSLFVGGPDPETWFERGYSEETAREIDCAIRGFIGRAFTRATEILRDRRDVLERGAKSLLEKETLTEPELAELAGVVEAKPRALLVPL
jgi:cell division protease FtsH